MPQGRRRGLRVSHLGPGTRLPTEAASLNPLAVATYYVCMSNNTFLVVAAVIILVLVGMMVVQKYEDCAEHGGKACPMPRYHTFDPGRPR